MTKSDILHALINHYSNGNKSQFAKKLGISAQGLSTWISRNTFDIDIIYSKCEHISAEWLITGEGNMFKQESGPDTIKSPSQLSPTNKRTEKAVKAFAEATKMTPGAIPLVSEQAVGGFAGMDFSVSERDVLAYYVIPKFQFLGVDFMIEVIGDSMIPKFYPGDIIACSIINHTRYIEWNKCHLIATVDRGLIVKRILQCPNKGYLTAVSDNKDYPPFDIPKDEITGMARIVGCIHLE